MKRPDRTADNVIGRRTAITGMALMGFVAAPARAEAVIHIGYLRWTEPRLAISLLDRPAADDGLAGARLALADNNSTGSFIGQRYEWQTIPVRAGDDVVGALNRLADDGIGLVLTDAPAPTILQLAPVASQRGITLFNIAAPDDALREENCSAAVIHVAPSRSMLADALAQYLVWKKWSRWVLAAGSHPDDALLADAYRRAAQRFGARIVKEIIYKDTGGSRQTDTGLLQTQQQMPVFTQGLPEYDVLVAADENEVFAGYLPYRTWDPRPVAGSAGLRPVTWDASSESWGGTQVQDRFRRMFHRGMTPLDMQAWTAMRLIGEAASRGGAEPQKLIGQLRSPDFGVGAHKGQKLTLRAWNGQLRQPILLSDGRNVVSVSPQPGFLHQVNELDTLGVDRPETRCKLP